MGQQAGGEKKKKKGQSNRTRQKKTREIIVKWNQMTALRFQTGGRHQTSPTALRECEFFVTPC